VFGIPETDEFFTVFGIPETDEFSTMCEHESLLVTGKKRPDTSTARIYVQFLCVFFSKCKLKPFFILVIHLLKNECVSILADL
jgi:hypothetical protein